MENGLKILMQKLGVADSFKDAGLACRTYDVDRETLNFFANMLGYAAKNEDEIAHSLWLLEEKEWRLGVDGIIIRQQGNLEFNIVVSEKQHGSVIEVQVSGQPVEVTVREQEKYNALGEVRIRKIVKINADFPIGYHELTINVSGKKYKSTLAVCPDKCYEAPAMQKQKIWGFAVQLYSVKSRRNWGVGDFTDLKELVRMCARSGASIIGLNPLNVLQHNYPENASPYCSISRLFLNPIYIDVEQVPEFLPEDKAEIAQELEDVHHAELIQYSRVYSLKMEMLKRCFERFEKSKNKERLSAYKGFCREQGADLDKLAAFEALYDEHCEKVWGGWRAWPEKYHQPDTAAVKSFVAEHKQKVEFFKFLQFEAARQFGEAQKVVEECGLGVGFYRDLAVGVGQDSAELWSNPELFLQKAGAGAPPDAFFPAGQKWCLGAFNPVRLKENRYEAFIKILRSNMKNAGALRIDHVMGLMRLYIIPDKGEQGTYLYYNVNDMLNIVALESHLNCCAVVGESIGNVPDGFLEMLEKRNIHPLSVLWSERGDNGWGDFTAPSGYPAKAFSSIGTHDMAPLRMWWFGYDIELSRSLGLIATEEEKAAAYHKRELDRWKLLFAMDSNGVWPEDNPRSENYIYGEKYPEGIEEAVHRFMSRCASQVLLVQFEDVLHVEKMQNLPGTDRDKHPNWRRKLPVDLENMESDCAYIRNIAAIKRER